MPVPEVPEVPLASSPMLEPPSVVEAQPGAMGSWAQGPAVGAMSVAESSALDEAPPVLVVDGPVLAHSAGGGSWWAQGPAVGYTSEALVVAVDPSSPHAAAARVSAPAAVTRASTGTRGRGVSGTRIMLPNATTPGSARRSARSRASVDVEGPS